MAEESGTTERTVQKEPDRRTEAHTNRSVHGDNGQAQAVTGATAKREPVNPYKRRPGETASEYYQRLRDEINKRPSSAADVANRARVLDEDVRSAIQSDPAYNAWRQGMSEGAYFDPVRNGGTNPRFEPSGPNSIGTNGNPYVRYAADGNSYEFRGDAWRSRDISVPHLLGSIDERYRTFTGRDSVHAGQGSTVSPGALVGTDPFRAMPPGLGRPSPSLQGGLGGQRRVPEPDPPPNPNRNPPPKNNEPDSSPNPSRKPKKEEEEADKPKKDSGVTTKGEPVSVTSGEYLETWADFDIPGTLPLGGARYMGTKLALPTGYRSPLGPCQISAFDELVSNPAPGRLLLHDASGREIGFERPFNFLPATNPAVPHLVLKAPWLGQLTLEDRRLVKRFRQYRDRVYRLVSVETPEGHRTVLHRDEAGTLARVDGPDGLSLRFENDAEGRRTAVVLLGHEGAELPLCRYAYDAGGRMREADCAFGMSVTYAWHPSAPLLLSWHNRTRRSETRFTYDDAGRVVHTATSGIWNDDRFAYDPERRETVYWPAGDAARAQRFRYDADENVTQETDALGGVVRHDYDEAGLRTATTDPLGHTRRTGYDRDGNVKRAADEEGRETLYGWGPGGALQIVIDPAGGTREWGHDEHGNVVWARDAEGHETRLRRDARGHVTEIAYPDGAVERRAHDGHNRLVAVLDPGGGRTTFAYDAYNRLVTITDPLGGVTRLAYEAGAGGFSTPSRVVRPDGVAVSRAYDPEGTLATVTDGEGRTTVYRHGAYGVLEAVTDPTGNTTRFAHDSEGRLVAVRNALGRSYRLERDAAGRVVAEADFDGTVTRYRRDAAGRVVETLKADGARLLYGYDRSGLVVAITAYGPGAFPPEVWAHEAAPREAPEDETRLTYDGRGLLESATNRAGTVRLERDREGRITAETADGRRVGSRYDAGGRRVERRIGEHRLGLAYDALGLPSAVAIGDHAPLRLARDALGREVERWSGAGFHLAQAWDAVGGLVAQVARRRAPDLPFAPRLHPGTRGPAGEGGVADGAPVVDRRFAWTRAYEPLQVSDGRWGTAAYTYDRNGQVGVHRHGDGAQERWAYDPAHDVAGFSDAAGGLEPWMLSPGGRVEAARGPAGERVHLSYDACGRVVERRVERDGFRPRTWRLAWDAADRLVGVETPDEERWTYAYDAFGRRTEKRLVLPQLHGAFVLARAARAGRVARLSRDEAAVGVRYLWDGDVVAEEAPLRADGRAAWEHAVRWHWEPGTFRPLAREGPDGTLLYAITDHLGTPRELVGEGGELVWAGEHRSWGALRRVYVAANENGVSTSRGRPGGPGGGRGGRLFTAGALALAGEDDEPDGVGALAASQVCPIRFPGQWEDAETGLFYNRHRHYDPLIAGYLSPDPIGLAGGLRPQGYVENPTSWSDPLGLDAQITRNVNPNDLIRTHSIEGSRSSKVVRGMVENMKVNGFGDEPITVVDIGGNRYVVDGHHRLAAAGRAGINVDIRTVPVESIISPGGYRSAQDIVDSAASAGRDVLRGPGGRRW